MKRGGTLTLRLSTKWFDKIWSGEKKIEYRVKKPYWEKRIEGKKLSAVRMFRGYNDGPSLTLTIDKIEVVDGMNTDLMIDAPVYAIHLGAPLALEAWDEFVRKANEELRCSAYNSLFNEGIDRDDVSYKDKRILVDICRRKGVIKKGEPYVKYYGYCGADDRFVYTAGIEADRICHEYGVFEDVC